MRRLLLLIISCLFSSVASAQLLQPVYSAPSPQAAALGEYGAVPVSHFTGMPEVSVPLFEIEAGDYKYPMGLSYHLASVKPHGQPGPVGLGWLLTDACISRTVRGVYDEKMDEGGVAHGYYGHYTKMQNITGGQFDSYTRDNLTGDNWFELSADEFSFSVNSHSGLFYLNPEGGWAVASNTYDSLGRLSSNSRTDNPQLTTQYSYNIRSWTTGISSPYFTETLYYNAARPGSSTGIQWGGNISSMAWEGSKAYDFTYDGLSRLTGASYVGDSSKSRQYAYDAHGNITGVTEGSTPHAYTYTGNHLAGTQYDSNGNTTSDSVTGIVSARYNVLNLPEEIIKSNGDTVRYVYGAGGTKLRERVIPPSPSGSVTKTDYVGNLVYRDDQLGRILVDGGSIVAKDSTLAPAYEFAFTDHLGSIRSLVTVGDSLFRKTEYGPYGEVLSENWTSMSTSPGGGSGGSGTGGEIEVEDEEEDDGGGGSRGLRSVSVIQTRLDNSYRYGGKERLDVSGLDLYDFGARQYDPALPRWLTMDPLAEKYYGASPYMYCVGNPVCMVDPLGRDMYLFNSQGEYVCKIGMKGEHRIAKETIRKNDDGSSFSQYSIYAFADPENDPLEIDNGTIDRIISVTNGEIEEMLSKQNVFKDNRLAIAYKSTGSRGYDYTSSTLVNKYRNVAQVEKDGRIVRSKALFLPEGESTVHNLMNFGNFLWGATGYTLGYQTNTLLLGANINSLCNPIANGYRPQLDAEDDQRSIELGADYARRLNFRAKRTRK